MIFNAASFLLGQNAVLEDLLKRMPGMEVSNDGTIKYNGETIPRITVGGKTFFSDDPKMALKNLPAKVVDKVKVIDKKTDAEEFTGVAENREKVMDLEFKQEFKEGWFGNAEAGLGSTLAGDRAAEMIDDRGLLYAGSVLVSGYTEKDQLTLVGNAGNSPIGGGGVVVFFSEEGASASMGAGLTTQEQAGVNYNTTRLKGLETSASAQFNHGFVDNRRKASRTTFVPGGNDNLSDTETKTFTSDHSLQANFELKNTDRKKILFTFRPRFTYTRGQREAYNDNRAQESGGEFLNSSSSSTFSLSHEADYSSSVELGFRNLGGNKRRSLTLNGQFSYTDYDADSREYSETRLRGADVAEVKDLFYDTDNRNGRGSLNFTYVEPLSANWALSAQGVGNITWRNNVKDAFGRTSGAAHFDASVVDKGDYRTPNAYYSTSSESRYVFFRELVQLQYQKGYTSIQFGANLQESLNEMTSVSRGITTQSGIGEWIIDWNPYLQLRWRKGQQANFFIFYNGNTLQPSVANMLPRLNLAVPTRLSLGNIYLQPSFRHNASFSINANNAAAQRSLSLSFSGGMTLRSSVSASWFDADGVHYSIPVNAAKPALNASIFSFFNTPLTADKRLTTTINLMTMYTRSVSFQNVRRLDPLDIDAFDYNAFMAGFWGSDERGETFYSGASGFSESLTHALRLAPSMSLRYRGDQVTASAGASTSMQSSRYSLDSDADTRTWTSTVNGSFDWTTKHGFELNTSARYYFFAGFPQGYNEPYLNWDFSLTKIIKAWALRFSIYDILNPENTELVQRDVADVVNYIKATEYAVERMNELPLCMRLLREVHTILLSGVRGSEKKPGELRSTQNWIGPGGSTLKNAAYIPPNIEDMNDSLRDLEKFINKAGDVDPIIKASLVHYQFETIHPFLDGNGRLGRLLITLSLMNDHALSAAVFYPSYQLKLRRSQYYEHLMAVRENGEYAKWVGFFCDCLLTSAENAVGSLERLVNLHNANTALINESLGRSATNGQRLLELLEGNPIVDVAFVVEKLDIARTTASNLVKDFVDLGMLVQRGKEKQRYRTFLYEDYLGILRQGSDPL